MEIVNLGPLTASRGSRSPRAGRNKYELVVREMLVTPQVKTVAIKTGIPLRTLTRMVADPQFQLMFKEAKLKLMDDALLKLRNAADTAVDTLIALCKSEYTSDAIKLAAACRILEFGDAADVKERFEGRLESIEAKTVEGAVITATNAWTDTNGNDNQTDYEIGESGTVAA